MLTRSRARSIGWAVILSLCFGLTMALTFRVNAVKSQVRLTERRIVSLRLEKGLLETEFETRANQQQLRSLNEVEFGYQAPTAGQYLETERQLAMLGKPVGPDAPEMIRVAHRDEAEKSADSILPAMVNPLTGNANLTTKANAAELPRARVHAVQVASADRGTALIERLSHVEATAQRLPASLKSGLKGGPKSTAKSSAKSKAATD